MDDRQPPVDGPDGAVHNPLCERETINALRRKHLFAFNKGLGQNFLCNPRIPRDIVRGAGIDEQFGVLEIGPGIGCLTYELAKQAGQVVAVEIDARLIPILRETLPFDNVQIVQADFMEVALHQALFQWFGARPVAVVANLPYYITTPIVMRLLEQAPMQLRSVTVMVQREVAERLCAPPGSDACGAISLTVDYYSKARILFKVPADSFVPMPKVDSAVVRFDLREHPPVDCRDVAEMFNLIKLGFGQRRKTLVNAVGNQGRFAKSRIAESLEQMGLSREIRAERMTLSQFARLTDLLLEAPEHPAPERQP
ncbi:MAG: 16S rRNA (adenine(1518)-N(6)/adenine(1519)-N(6))-dimethyltransferase RsmA [Clostridiales bacterium]|nr:16S rRNA (adenine(1518)-N(6)/adenine(1519)-N(6))-dimethyltransferase RsmA [Clostridiales bacterium]